MAQQKQQKMEKVQLLFGWVQSPTVSCYLREESFSLWDIDFYLTLQTLPRLVSHIHAQAHLLAASYGLVTQSPVKIPHHDFINNWISYTDS